MEKYINSKIAMILLLGFSSGLPLGLIGSTLQAWFTVAGASLVTIGWLSLIGQPYAFKFLWAPLLDRFSLSRLGRRRGWILAMQIAMSICLFVMVIFNPHASPKMVGFLAFLIAIFSATQDTAIDAYRTELLSEQETGVGVSANTVGYRVAMIVSTAFALMLTAIFSWQMIYCLMAVLFILLALVTFKAPRVIHQAKPPASLKEAVIAPAKEFLGRRHVVMLVLFIVIYKLCDAMALSLNTTFLIRGVGFSLVEIGAISKGVGLAAALLGSVVGGVLMPRLGVYRALMCFGILQMLSNLLFAWLAVVGKITMLMAVAVFGENFFGGMATIAFVVFLMNNCDRRYTATQYALFSALAALGRIFIGPISAVVVKHVGWVDFYILSTLVGLPALFILRQLKTVVTQAAVLSTIA